MMDPIIVFLVISVVLFLLDVPIAFVLLISSTVFLVMSGFQLTLVTQKLVAGVDSFLLLAIPLFILTAELLNKTGITTKIFDFADALVGRIRGGLAHANIVSSVMFAGMSGSAAADAAGLGSMEVKAMTDKGFDRPFSAAVTAASSTIGPIIPPSIPMVLYGSLAGVSIGKLFLGGIIPGIVMAFGMSVVAYWIAWKRNYPRSAEPFSFRRVWLTFRGSFLGLLAPVILLGGIYSGIFTPTEAAGVAVIYALLIGLLVFREISLKDLKEVLINTVVNTSLVGMIIGAAALYSWVLTIEQIPLRISTFFLEAGLGPVGMLLILNVLFLILGCIMEINAILLIFVPIVLPVIVQLGIDPLHFGVVMVFNLMIGTLTPPFGMTTMLLSGIARVPFIILVKELLPFIAVLIVVLFLITYVPSLVMFLPNLFIQ